MNPIEDGMSLDASQVYEWSRRLLNRNAALHDRILWRRQNHHNDPAVDPQINERTSDGRPVPDDPFADVARFQSDAPRRVAQQVVARLTENPIRFHTDVRRSTDTKLATRASIVLNAWKAEIEERTGINWQQAMAHFQCRDCYAVMHTYRLEDLRPPVEQRKYIAEHDIPAGERHRFMESEEGAYVEKVDAWKERRADMYAECGSPWQVEFPDPLFFAGQRDRRGPGFLTAVLAYEVDAFEYDLLTRESGNFPTPLNAHAPAPGLEDSRGQQGVGAVITPSSTDYRSRRRVWQFWTRDEYYELAEYPEQLPRAARRRAQKEGADFGSAAMRLVKAFKHGYPGVPFEVVWANRTYDLDPVWEAEPYLEGLYRLKPFWDYMMTRVAAIMDLSANPPLIEQDSPQTSTLVLSESGDIPDEDSLSSLGNKLPPGRNMRQLQVQITAGISQVLQLITAMLAQAEPPTGTVEIGASTAPWTARIWQTQANIGPRLLIDNQVKALRWLVEFWRKWHVANPDEPFVAYAHPLVSRTDLVEVDPADLARVRFEVTISPYSSAEMLTIAEHLRTFVEAGLRKREELFKDGFGERDPHEYAISLDVENMITPMRKQLAQVAFASRMASMFTMNTRGEVSDFAGNQVSSREVLQRNGYKVPSLIQQKALEEAQGAGMQQAPLQQAPPQGNPGGGSVLTRTTGASLPVAMGQMPTLKAPGSIAIQGPTA